MREEGALNNKKSTPRALSFSKRKSCSAESRTDSNEVAISAQRKFRTAPNIRSAVSAPVKYAAFYSLAE